VAPKPLDLLALFLAEKRSAVDSVDRLVRAAGTLSTGVSESESDHGEESARLADAISLQDTNRG